MLAKQMISERMRSIGMFDHFTVSNNSASVTQPTFHKPDRVRGLPDSFAIVIIIISSI